VPGRSGCVLLEAAFGGPGASQGNKKKATKTDPSKRNEENSAENRLM